MSRPPVFVDFFAGAGGLSLGLAQAGLLPVFACDSIEVACVTHRANLGERLARLIALAGPPPSDAQRLLPGEDWKDIRTLCRLQAGGRSASASPELS